MRIKQNSILITLLFVLSIGLIIMTRNNCQINSKLKECNLKLLEKSIALGSAVWAITQCHKYTNERIKDLDLIVDRQKRPFSLEFNDGYKLFSKFSLSDCSSCIESELKNITGKMKSVNILIETQSLRDFKAFVAINHIDTAKVFQIEKPILEEVEPPFYFVTNRELYIKDLFFPMSELPDLAVEFYQIVQDKYLN